MSRVVHRILSAPSGVELVNRAIELALCNPPKSPPLWRSWTSWVQSFGGNFDGCNVQLQEKLVLHHGLSLPTWKHECRTLLSISAVCLAKKMDRGLTEFRPDSFDTFLMHHVTCSGTESNGSETFACGGVNCRDRNFRHLKNGSSLCEHPECGVTDTPSHRLYKCSATAPHRLRASWTQEQTDMTKANGFACHHYGMWALPAEWVRDLASSVMALVDFDFIQQAVNLARRVSVRFTPASMPSRILKLWFNNFPSRRRSASVGV
eukprot:5500653-Amphidinium_carterae.1